jgi:hypothetical protein
MRSRISAQPESLRERSSASVIGARIDQIVGGILLHLDRGAGTGLRSMLRLLFVKSNHAKIDM